MTGFTYEAVDAHSPRAPDYTLQLRVHVFLLLSTDLQMSGQTSIVLVIDVGLGCYNVDQFCA